VKMSVVAKPRNHTHSCVRLSPQCCAPKCSYCVHRSIASCNCVNPLFSFFSIVGIALLGKLVVKQRFLVLQLGAGLAPSCCAATHHVLMMVMKKHPKEKRFKGIRTKSRIRKEWQNGVVAMGTNCV